MPSFASHAADKQILRERHGFSLRLTLSPHKREQDMTQEFEFTLNGRPVSVALDNEETPLLNVLRNESRRDGRTVRLRARSVRLLHGADRRRAREVLLRSRCGASPARPSRRSRGWARRNGRIRCKQAFIDEQAGQCGYCLAGILISAKALLDRNPQPTRSEIAQALDGNICRCGAHNRIMRAIEKAAAQMRAGANAGVRQ